MNLGNDIFILYDFPLNNYEIFIASAPTYGKYYLKMKWFDLEILVSKKYEYMCV